MQLRIEAEGSEGMLTACANKSPTHQKSWVSNNRKARAPLHQRPSFTSELIDSTNPFPVISPNYNYQNLTNITVIVSDTTIAAMSSKLQQTVLSFFDAFRRLSAANCAAMLAPTATYQFGPASVGLPVMDQSGLAVHVNTLASILSSFTINVKETFENKEQHQVVVWATGQGIFKDEARDSGITEEDWVYNGEFMLVITLDESEEKIERVIDFLDSIAVEKMKALMARAKENLEKKGVA